MVPSYDELFLFFLFSLSVFFFLFLSSYTVLRGLNEWFGKWVSCNDCTVRGEELQYWFGIVNYVNYVTYKGLCIDYLVLYHHAGFVFCFSTAFSDEFLTAVVAFFLWKCLSIGACFISPLLYVIFLPLHLWTCGWTKTCNCLSLLHRLMDGTGRDAGFCD